MPETAEVAHIPPGGDPYAGAQAKPIEAAMAAVIPLLREAAIQRASDVHVASGKRPRMRKGSTLPELGDPIHNVLVEALYKEVRRLSGDMDSTTLNVGGVRWRTTSYDTIEGFSITFRRIDEIPPPLEQLGLPEEVRSFAQREDGLVIVAGGTGSGKSTTCASLINTVNLTREAHILTIEDPVEYKFSEVNSLISQREVPQEHQEAALLRAMRSDPDVILFGECRSEAHIELCLTLATTGHLVITTLHARDAASALNRLFGCGETAKTMAAQSLTAIVSQKLIPSAEDKTTWCLAAEIFEVEVEMRALIQKADVNRLAINLRDKRKSMDNVLANMVMNDRILREDGRNSALSPAHFDELLSASV